MARYCETKPLILLALAYSALPPGVCIAQDPRLVISGESAGDYFGVSLSGGVDLDGDGTTDLIVGAFNYQRTNPYLQLGGKSDLRPGYVRVHSAGDGSVLQTLRGQSDHRRFGDCVDIVSDVNGDDRPDMLVGAPAVYRPGALANATGRATVYSGKDGSSLFDLGEDRKEANFGCSVAGLGDIDGDGRGDFAVGCTRSTRGAGFVVIYSGKQGSVLRQLDGSEGERGFGSSLADAGDVNRDGIPDLIVGSRKTEKGERDKGAARVFSGKDGKALFGWEGEAAHDYFGTSVESVGDLDRDGYIDLIVGAPGIDTEGEHCGGIYVFSGKDGSVLLRRYGEKGDEFGHHVAGLGDIDGDKTPDFAVGSAARPAIGNKIGFVRVFSGRDGSVLMGVPARSSCGLGDLDNDGFADFATACESPSPDKEQPGVVRVFSGASVRKHLENRKTDR